MCMLIKFKILYSKWKIEGTHSTFNMDLLLISLPFLISNQFISSHIRL